MRKQINKMNQAENELTQELKRKPKENEIADRMKESVEIINRLKIISQTAISLDSPIGSKNGNDLTYGDTIVSDSLTPEKQLIKEEDKKDSELIREAFIKSLFPHEKTVLYLRSKKKITKVAKELGVGRERIATIEDDIKRKWGLFYQSEEYKKLTEGKTENLLKKIVEKHKKNIDISAIGVKHFEYENYENLQEIV